MTDRGWTPAEADAWIGLLETHKRITRALDAELDAAHGLGLSTLELLSRLAAAGEAWPRLSALAAETGLSLSRVSRHMDALERRGLVVRRRCETDSRAVEAHLTDDGARVVAAAEAAHAEAVREQFLSRLSAEEAATLARVFARFAPRAAQACAVAQAESGGNSDSAHSAVSSSRR
ncbi:MAG TPA: MarR family transcriptional regulator [Baekduia sp.]|uniref:MarR family winged helix-turn-helix transcriptional regulator n=1 Tax=Baekduia sp. TaxID=2600305 RepID=UPI002D79B5DC|nr:MarR family transcriptional regulator [Baekduia sp.]HET6506765.1 MarR family transcriptional regulator [Baekduia sp.]